ncbi:FecR domain-containing protein [Bradyrhizobium lablabi]|uniref:FecR domain-containing protein n=1 Tax=Bradyrhizobium lablabi TaxID=722472 RepID=UPI001BA67175|nr:FecR domain-containing protein [Bradyrhizobium lablabi]MBR1120314.1 FecR domain-containing protein [Bradyrhizobium lablabi]
MAIVYAALGVSSALNPDAVSAQPANMGCATTQGPNATQTLRCRGDVIIVAEDGARYTLQSHARSGDVDTIDLQSKAVLIDAPKPKAKHRLQVITPQAIAAVRGTKWAVDVQDTRTSVLVLRGRVAVRRPSGGRQVQLGPGEGVDVDRGSTEPLTVKRWGQPRVDALLARLGQ